MSFTIGFILGLILCYLIIRIIKISDDKILVSKLNNKKSSNKDEMIIDAVGSGINVLLQYHGEKVKVEKGYYLMCWIEKDLIALPKNCLVPIHDQEESEQYL